MLITNAINFFKYKRLINNIIKQENLLENFSSVFSSDIYRVKFKTDWIGRIYAVVNPSIISQEERIFEFDANGTNIDSFVHKWMIEHMIAADNFVKNHGIFDILSYKIEKLDENYNYLIVFTNIAWFDFWKSLKRFMVISPIVLALIIAALIIFL